MASRLYRATVFALYQCSLLLGLILMPFALVARRVGFTLPVHYLVKRFGDAYERVASSRR